MLQFRGRIAGIIGLVAVVSLGACGGGGGSKSSAKNPLAGLTLPSLTTTTGSTGTTVGANEPRGSATGKIRIANLFAPNGQPGPALDFYDTPHPAASDNPLISNLGYGQVSQYVAPRASDPGGSSNLYIFPAGSKTNGTPFIGMQSGSNISNAGWNSGQQFTIVMGTNSQGMSGQPNPTFQDILESAPGPDEAPIWVKPETGKGVVGVNLEGFPPDAGPNPSLRIDGTCPSNIDPQTNKPAAGSGEPAVLGSGTGNANFVLASGSHTFEVPLSPGAGQALTAAQCKSTKASASGSVQVPDGQRVIVFIYGPSRKDLRIASTGVG